MDGMQLRGDQSAGLLENLSLPLLLATASPSIAASPSVNLTNFSSSGLYVRKIALGSTIVYLDEELGRFSHNIPAFIAPRDTRSPDSIR